MRTPSDSRAASRSATPGNSCKDVPYSAAIRSSSQAEVWAICTVVSGVP
jgi:hypothetical protein